MHDWSPPSLVQHDAHRLVYKDHLLRALHEWSKPCICAKPLLCIWTCATHIAAAEPDQMRRYRPSDPYNGHVLACECIAQAARPDPLRLARELIQARCDLRPRIAAQSSWG